MVSITSKDGYVELKCIVSNRLYCVRVFYKGRPVGRQLFKDFDSAWEYFDSVRSRINNDA